MPYASKAQAGYMHAAMERGDIKPSVVQDFDSASKGHMGHLPEHVKKMAHGGYACMHCGGEVGEDGYAEGSEEEEDSESPAEELSEQEARAAFDEHLRGRR